MSNKEPLKPRFHVEGQASTEGPRWLIWDGNQHRARFKNIASSNDAVAICEELNSLTRTPDSAPQVDGLVGELEVLLKTYRDIPYNSVDYDAAPDAAINIANLLAENPTILTALRASDRDSVIEECAGVCDAAAKEWHGEDYKFARNASNLCASEIRALKGDPKP